MELLIAAGIALGLLPFADKWDKKLKRDSAIREAELAGAVEAARQRGYEDEMRKSQEAQRS